MLNLDSAPLQDASGKQVTEDVKNLLQSVDCTKATRVDKIDNKLKVALVRVASHLPKKATFMPRGTKGTPDRAGSTGRGPTGGGEALRADSRRA